MKKIDVADEVAQQECNNNKCYASAYIYIYIYIYICRCHGNTMPNLVRTQFYYFSKMP